jgi:hypothetical protein
VIVKKDAEHTDLGRHHNLSRQVSSAYAARMLVIRFVLQSARSVTKISQPAPVPARAPAWLLNFSFSHHTVFENAHGAHVVAQQY